MKLVVGLGNPGPKYAGTRHNIGFDVVDYLAAAPGVGRWRSRFEAPGDRGCRGERAGPAAEARDVHEPERPGGPGGGGLLQAAGGGPAGRLRRHRPAAGQAAGRGRRGRDGGQNGLRNIQEHLGTQDYARLRIGVGSPGEHLDAADHVLSRFKPGERKAVEDAVAQAAQAVLVWVRHGIDVVHEPGNGEPKPERPKKEKPAKDKAEQGRRPTRRQRNHHRTRKNEPAMPVNSYECLFLLDPTKTATDLDGVRTQLHHTLEKYGAEILASRKWDDRKLAYPIKGHKKGLYYLTYSRPTRRRSRSWTTTSG